MGSHLYVLVQGQCSIQKWNNDKRRQLEVARVRDDSEHTYFGEVGACTPHARRMHTPHAHRVCTHACSGAQGHACEAKRAE